MLSLSLSVLFLSCARAAQGLTLHAPGIHASGVFPRFATAFQPLSEKMTGETA